MLDTIDRIASGGSRDWDDEFDKLAADAEMFSHGIDTSNLHPTNWGEAVRNRRQRLVSTAPLLGTFTVQHPNVLIHHN